MILSLLFLFAPQARALDAAKLEALLGRKPAAEGRELKVSIPHRLGVAVDGFPIVPAMGATSWVGFSEHGERVMAMGDLVLLEDELPAVQKAAIAAGLEVTAIHNHFLRDKPKLMYMHVSGSGTLDAVAKSVRAALDAQEKARAGKKQDGPAEAPGALDAAELERIVGRPGKTAGGVFKIVVGRPDVPLEDMGAGVTSFLGFNTWMAFEGTKEKAAVAGDFAMRTSEVGDVVRALVEHGLEVTAMHNHMLTEQPRVVFLHFWGVGPAADLAKGLRAALDQTGAKP